MPRRVVSHDWLIAPTRLDRAAGRSAGRIPAIEIDAHRNRGGPYTAARALVRALAVELQARDPDLLARHALTLLLVAPDLRGQLAVSKTLAQFLDLSREGNAKSWTRRIARGLVAFLLDAAQLGALPRRIDFEHADHVDSLDAEFLAELIRRADPKRIAIGVGSASADLPEPLKHALHAQARIVCPQPVTCDDPAIPHAWRGWLLRHADGWSSEWAALTEVGRHLDLAATRPPRAGLAAFLAAAVRRLEPETRRALALEYVESDCTADALLPRAAYLAMPGAMRRALHKKRTDRLESSGGSSGLLGAVPFHREQEGADPRSLLAAATICMRSACYAAARDWAERGRRLIGPDRDPKTWGELTRHILFAALLLGNYDSVEAICREALAADTDPALCAHATYAIAILNARFYKGPRRDTKAARDWIARSRAYTERVPPSEARTVNLAFLRNTLALVELREANRPGALALLDEALDILGREAPGKYPAESVIVWHNRARLHMLGGENEAAIADLTALLAQEPCNSEAHFDRGRLHQQAGRLEAALADYDAAIAWSPPYPESHFNRALVLTGLGRVEDAIEDYGAVLTFDPAHIEARVKRASLLVQQGRLKEAECDVAAARALAPRDARALCLSGLLALKRQRLSRALADLDAAVAADPALADAWANRASVHFQRSALDAALADLDRALSLREDAAARFNRGRVLAAQGRWREALTDYDRALATGGVDAAKVERYRDAASKLVR